MTEAEWFSQAWPSCPIGELGYTERKLFLFLAAFIPRLCVGRMCPVCEEGMPLFEAQAEGQAHQADWKRVIRSQHPILTPGEWCPTKKIFRLCEGYLRGIYSRGEFWYAMAFVEWGTERVVGSAWPRLRPEHEAFLVSLRPYLDDVFGNPFRPIQLAPTWVTSTVTALATQMYESRDFSAMPILADALQDAGCDSRDILDHCRGPGAHVRGCFVVDLILQKA